MKTSKNEDKLLKEAAEWRMIGLLFECPVNDWRNEVNALAAEMTDKRLKKAAVAAVGEGSEGMYHSIFGPGGPAPPREVSYRSWIQPGYLLSELSAYYAAFSYHPETPDPPDHVAIETGFISYLRLKQAYAELLGDAEHASIASDAAQKFISEHLVKIAHPLAKTLEFSGVDYLAMAAGALLERVGKDKDAGARRNLPIMETGATEDDGFFECGSADGSGA
ncbi:MAG TPA: hypothetical protein DEA22_12490 [Blastocatellia bacterium]|nr:hypothetical protein [Blastocatellia bacterium]